MTDAARTRSWTQLEIENERKSESQNRHPTPSSISEASDALDSDLETAIVSRTNGDLVSVLSLTDFHGELDRIADPIADPIVDPESPDNNFFFGIEEYGAAHGMNPEDIKKIIAAGKVNYDILMEKIETSVPLDPKQLPSE